jgi:phosphatidylserine/phosphatidylglycerophosphate/cardiolipin synthase-like enzyme
LVDGRHHIARNKVMVIDGRVVITGSFNFTKAAEESNAENLLVIRDEKLAAKYVKNGRSTWRIRHRMSGRRRSDYACRQPPGRPQNRRGLPEELTVRSRRLRKA